MNQHAVLHALTLEPAAARAGESVRLCFRTPNLGDGPSPAGRIRFALPPELSAEDDLVQPVASVAAGEDVVATLDARVMGPLDDGTLLSASAFLDLDDRTLETNSCTLVVRSRPVLDGAGSGVSVCVRDHETVAVRAVITNEGDGPACDLEAVVPPPLGCVRIDGDGPARASLVRLDVGERFELAFDARIVGAVRTLVADDGFVRCGDRIPVALPARERVELQPSLAPPAVSIAFVSRRAEMTIAVRNDGWLDARDVIVRVALPAPLRPLEGSIVVDGIAALRRPRGGAFARFERDGATTTIVLARVGARASVEVALAAAIPTGFTAAPARVELGGHDVTAEFDIVPVRALQLTVIDHPRTAERGSALAVLVEVTNAGEIPESVVLAVSGAELADSAEPAVRTIAPGTVAQIPLALQLGREHGDGAQVDVTILASDANGERARTQFAVIVRDRAWLTVLEPPMRVPSGVAYTLRNGGTTTAREVTVEIGETSQVLGAIAPGASVSVVVSDGDARSGGIVRVEGRDALPLPAPGGSVVNDVALALEAPAEVLAGAPFSVSARIAVRDPADRIALRVGTVEGASYIAGSTVLDGVALLDRLGDTPLAAEGLVLRGVPAGTESILVWSMLAASGSHGDELTIGLGCVADGVAIDADPVTVAIRHRDAFAVRPAGLGYHVEACGILPQTERPRAADPAPPEPLAALACAPAFEPPPREDRFFFSLSLNDRRLDEIARIVRGADSHSLASHLLLVRALFPERETSGDPLVGRALRDAAEALQDVFDRLFVKLRIPGFDAGASDLEDPRLRRALVRLFEDLANAEPGGEEYGTACARVERTQIRMIHAHLADAEYGAPEMLRALLALIPTDDEDEPLLSAALRRYVEALDRALARCEGLSSEAYDAALGTWRQDDLDEARARVLAAVRARTTVAGAA